MSTLINSSTSKYNHVEAFCLMYYHSETTNFDFWVWNSRDGVTPFCVIEDGVEFRHTNWKWDKCLPDFVLVDGHRYFRDITAEEATEFAQKRLESFVGTEYEVEHGSAHWDELMVSLANSFVGGPRIVKFDKAADDEKKMQAMLVEAREKEFWFWADHYFLILTPDEMEKDRFAWRPEEWKLIDPKSELKSKRIIAHNARVTVTKWEEKMRVNGIKVPA